MVAFNLFRATRLSMLNISDEAALLRTRQVSGAAASPSEDAEHHDTP